MHKRTHKQSAKIPCDANATCKSTFFSTQALKRHKKLHHPDVAEVLPCTHVDKGCKKVFSNKSLLKEHLRVCSKGTPEEKRECPYCHKEMAARYLHKHVKNVHQMQECVWFKVLSMYMYMELVLVARLLLRRARLYTQNQLDCTRLQVNK